MFGLSPLPRTLDAALRDVADPKPLVRISALRDLSRHADGAARARVLSALQTALREDTTEAVRAEAALVLADVGAEESSEALLDALRSDAAQRVRQLALVALGEVGRGADPATLAAVERATHDSAPELRFQGVIALAQLAGPSALPRIRELSLDRDPAIRYIALRLLEEHGAHPAEPAVIVRAREALEDEAPDVRLAAALLLARHDDRAGADVLIAALNSRRAVTHPEDEHAAVEWAGAWRLERARPGLERRAFGLFSRAAGSVWHARAALARLGDERAQQAILRALSGWSRETRTLAAAAAGRARLSQAKPLLLALTGDASRADPETVREALAAVDCPSC